MDADLRPRTFDPEDMRIKALSLSLRDPAERCLLLAVPEWVFSPLRKFHLLEALAPIGILRERGNEL